MLPELPPHELERRKGGDAAHLVAGAAVLAAHHRQGVRLAPRGEGFTLWKDGHAAPGGRLPINTNGGGLSYTHPGMYGMFLLIEATRQLRGECGERQVPGARLACVNGTGGTLSSTGTLILGVD